MPTDQDNAKRWRPNVCERDKAKNSARPGGLAEQIGYYFWFFGYVAKLPYEREILKPVV